MTKFIADIECKSCGGTGLYSGWAEKKGEAVVCSTCGGTGCQHYILNYIPFKKRKGKKDIHTVHASGGANSGGISYKEWLEGGDPAAAGREDRTKCPFWWYQNIDYKSRPDWEECPLTGAFCDCKYFKNREQCWERYEKEHPRRFRKE